MNELLFLDVPELPFKEFKWKWATLQCTEGINDPVVLLGVLFRMAKLEGRFKYSSDEFANELLSLDKDLKSSGINVDVCGRIGERNLIRNSGVCWRCNRKNMTGWSIIWMTSKNRSGIMMKTIKNI